MLSTDLYTTLPATSEAPARARRFVRAIPLGGGLLQSDLELIVTELVANSVVHNDLSPTEALSLQLRCGSKHVRGAVCDPGGGFKWQPGTSDPIGSSGLGLFLVDRLADRWGVSQAGATCVWFELRALRLVTPREGRAEPSPHM